MKRIAVLFILLLLATPSFGALKITEYTNATVDNQIATLQLLRNVLGLVTDHMDENCTPGNCVHTKESNDIWQIMYNRTMVASWGTKYNAEFIEMTKSNTQIEGGKTPEDAFGEFFDTLANRSGDIFGDSAGTEGQAYIKNNTIATLNTSYPAGTGKRGENLAFQFWMLLKEVINVVADMYKDASDFLGTSA